MNSAGIQILLGPSELADLLQIPEARINAVIALGQAPKPTRSLNSRRLKWHEADVPAWLRAIDSLTNQGINTDAIPGTPYLID